MVVVRLPAADAEWAPALELDVTSEVMLFNFGGAWFSWRRQSPRALDLKLMVPNFLKANNGLVENSNTLIGGPQINRRLGGHSRHCSLLLMHCKNKGPTYMIVGKRVGQVQGGAKDADCSGLSMHA